jgi:hypothetical protein
MRIESFMKPSSVAGPSAPAVARIAPDLHQFLETFKPVTFTSVL